MALPKKVLLLTLNTFSSTGGIEKVCRVAGKALREIQEESGGGFRLFSLYDRPGDLVAKYIPANSFKAYSGNRIQFVLEAVKAGRQSEAVILSHINLLIIGYLIKLLSPKTKVYLIAHGIEVWAPLPPWKIRVLKKLDLILPVSEFTRQKMISLYGLAPQQLEVLNNCLDPFLQKSLAPGSVPALKEKYGFEKSAIVLFTLTRLKSSEQYKGYDRVISALPSILEKHPATRYLIAGKYDVEEKERLETMIRELDLEGKVVFTGFLLEEETEACFTLADAYVMPSTGEGFGIVFVEAQFYGKPVIAGNVDGSVDALAGGKLGILVNPHQQEEIVQAIQRVLANPVANKPDQDLVQEYFGFCTYKERLKRVLRRTT